MAGVARRIAEAEAALVTLDEATARASNSVIERDGAILRLVYTFEALWKACQQLLAEREGIEVGSPNGTIRAARRLGLLCDDDAEAAMRIPGTATSRSICIAAGSERRSKRSWATIPPCCAGGLTP